MCESGKQAKLSECGDPGRWSYRQDRAQPLETMSLVCAPKNRMEKIIFKDFQSYPRATSEWLVE